MQETSDEWARRLREREFEELRKAAARPRPARELPTIPYTELAEAPPESPIATEWNSYRRQVGRLLAGGNQGKWVLITGEQIIGIWDTFEEAKQAEASVAPPVMLKQILEREPLIKIGYSRVCPS